ncbi:MAG: hypothetical protein PVJ67_03215 [Candidatus Pacearchaeota archaeon]
MKTSLEDLNLDEPVVESSPINSINYLNQYSKYLSNSLEDSKKKIKKNNKKYGGEEIPLEGIKPLF